MDERVIGHYQILEKIGAGGMGEVFRARDERLGRDVALKIIRSGFNDRPDHVRRFEQEARAAAALNHPNIVAVYDVGSDNGAPYIVCELLEGKTLRAALLPGPLPVRTTVDYALQIVQGLIAAHERRIVHRDLKPENLFLTKDGRIKILDFGIAKLQSPDDADRSVQDLTTVTRNGAMVGTVAYMSPEQLRAKTVDHRSDIFSMGAVLYEMLAGRRPFRGETEVDTMSAVLLNDPPEIDLEQAGIPAALKQIVGHCLEKEPENRFQSSLDLKFALENLTPSATRISAFNALHKPQRSSTKLLPWALAALVLVLTAVLAAKYFLPGNAFTLQYKRITFEEGTVYSARFAPDHRSIVYGAAWNQKPLQLFSTVGDSPLAQPLNLADANLLGISNSGELALALHGMHGSHLKIEKGILARAPLAGGSPREVMEDVPFADWDENGQLAIVHHAEGRDRIEYPVGHVLFQSDGWISHLRIDPQSHRIAFINHPTLWDDPGSILVIDVDGSVKSLSPQWPSADGLAWSPDGKEIWFTAAMNGYTRRMMAVSVSGKIRTVLSIPVGLTLHDIAPDGRVLVSLDAERIAMATQERNAKPVNISWHDWDIAKDISQDGQSVLFEDSSEAASPNYSVAIRKIDGSMPIRLGEGSAGGLSPDGKWAIGIVTGMSGQVVLYPVGTGQPHVIPIKGLEKIQYGTAHFLADGNAITINGNEAGHAVRCYLADINSGKLTPVTPEGVTGSFVSPDGKFIIGRNGTILAVYPIAGGAARPIPGVEPGFIPLQWGEDNSTVFGYRQGELPTKVYKLNVMTGEKTFLQDLQPETSAGLVAIAPVIVNRSGSRFAYSYYQVLSVIYVISGLH